MTKDQQLEQAIEAATIALTHKPTKKAFQLVKELIAQRSPEQVKRMEFLRGLA